MISDYARNGREAVNMIQTLAGISINEDRSFIGDEDIEWMAHSSQLTASGWIKKLIKTKGRLCKWISGLWP